MHITDTGRELIREIRTNRASTVSDLLTRMGAEDERAIADALPALGRLIELIAPRMQEGYPLLRNPLLDGPSPPGPSVAEDPPG